MKDKYWVIEMENIPQENQRIANEYLLTLKLAKKGEATIDKYRWILEKFFRECPKELNELTSEDVLNWLRTYYKDKKEKTQELILSVLSSFFQYCQSEEYIDKVLVKNRWRPKLPKPLPKYLNDHEVALVKIQADKMSLRDRAIVNFLLSSGCRRSEVSGLNVDDIDLVERTAKVVGKGKKIREVHFSEECALLLKEYLLDHPTDEPALFLNKHGERLGSFSIYKVTTKLGKKAGLLRSLNPHSLRHTFATNMLSRGAELEFIGEELGHNDLNTTRIYARIPSEEIISEYQKIME